jgi:hypothetical protein
MLCGSPAFFAKFYKIGGVRRVRKEEISELSLETGRQPPNAPIGWNTKTFTPSQTTNGLTGEPSPSASAIGHCRPPGNRS